MILSGAFTICLGVGSNTYTSMTTEDGNKELRPSGYEYASFEVTASAQMDSK
jgi:hypothetical protein